LIYFIALLKRWLRHWLQTPSTQTASNAFSGRSRAELANTDRFNGFVKYGANSGKYRVIDALSTLGFGHPTRSEFFLKELENFLILTRQEHVDPLQPMGSYAGAMGFPQFMPSSYLAYAEDFDLDNKRDIRNNPADAVAFQVSASGEAFRKALSKGVKPDTSVKQLRKSKVTVPKNLSNKASGKLLSYPRQDHEELWLGLENFYVITRNNHSPLYAMAVLQLSQAIKAGM
jgi:membrane-bound lytic murein transglycosylase B